MPVNFFSLPWELRQMVYEYALLYPEPIRFQPSERPSALRPDVALFAANKALNLEASPIFYGRNCFIIPTDGALETRWILQQIGTRNLAHLRHLASDCLLWCYGLCSEISFSEEGLDRVLAIAQICPEITSFRVLLDGALWSKFARNFPGPWNDVVHQGMTRLLGQVRVFPKLRTAIIAAESFPDDSSHDEELQRALASNGWTVRSTSWWDESQPFAPSSRNGSRLA